MRILSALFSRPDPWSRALPTLKHLDEHSLKDVGAPAWVISEVERQRIAEQRRMLLMAYR